MRLIFPVLLAIAAGCGGSKPPTYQLSQAQASIRAAEEVGAEQTPQAALHLKMAKDNQRDAESMISGQDHYDEANHALKRAQADAELAILLAKEAKARAEADEAKDKIKKLKQEME
jgi:anthranilate phosphoribosyltransferase